MEEFIKLIETEKQVFEDYMLLKREVHTLERHMGGSWVCKLESAKKKRLALLCKTYEEVTKQLEAKLKEGNN